MKHYPHHIGDFDRATRHLTRIERSVYRDMLDLYYDTETELSLDFERLCRKILANDEQERTAVQQVLNEFFIKTPTGWFNSRCDEEIQAYRANTSSKSLAGKASAAARAEKKAQKGAEGAAHAQRMLNGCSTDVQQEPNTEATNQEPGTRNQEPISIADANASEAKLGESPALPGDPPPPEALIDPDDPTRDGCPLPIPCPHLDVIALWAEVMPDLQQVVPSMWDGTRASNLRARWRKVAAEEGWQSKAEGLAWWRELLAQVRKSDFLMGRTKSDRPFQLTLDWLVLPNNFVKVIEGRYHR